MRRLLVLTLLAVAVAAPPARAAGGPPAGESCTVVYQTDDTGYSGVVTGGPVLAPGSVVSLRCSIAFGYDATNASAPAQTFTAGPSGDTAVVAPQQFAYADASEPLVLCSAATVEGTTWYRDSDTRSWTTDVNTRCAWDDAVFALADAVLHAVGECGLDEPCIPEHPDRVCQRTIGLEGQGVPGVVEVGPDGDVVVGREPFYDCPPYVV
jgi:hypothetical protein